MSELKGKSVVPVRDSAAAHDERVDTHEQPLIEHLIELRARLLRAILALFIAFIAIYTLVPNLFDYVAEPLMSSLPAGSSMIATKVASPFTTPMKLAFYAAVFVTVPYLLFQLWAFVAPGLYSREKAFGLPLLISSILLFYVGAAFAYFAVFPVVFGFFVSISPINVKVMTDINEYLDFALSLFFAFGAIFEVPVATVLLVRMGFTTATKLREMRPYVIVGCFVVGMILTPPDVVSQCMMAIPMWLLYEIGVLACRLVERRTTAPT